MTKIKNLAARQLDLPWSFPNTSILHNVHASCWKVYVPINFPVNTPLANQVAGSKMNIKNFLYM